MEKSKEESEDRCLYIFQRGTTKGLACSNQAIRGYRYCKQCSRKASVTNNPNNRVNSCIPEKRPDDVIERNIELEEKREAKSQTKKEEIFQVLPKKSNDEAVKTDIEQLQCPICSENIKNSTVQCGHMFCIPCIREVYEKNKSCPLCKEEITKITKLYV